MSAPAPDLAPDLASVSAAFRERFGADPDIVVRAPGRVNLIGEHTDYNDGFVLPMAIDRSAWIALRPRPDRLVRAVALDLDGDEAEFDLDALARGEGWAEYLKGVAWALTGAGAPVSGWEGVIASDVPRGAGLSSSAALEMATARAFAAVTGHPWDGAAMARAGQRAENAWVGVNTGIMDQLISALGREGSALLLDCRSLEGEPVPLPPGTRVVVLDSGTRRGLVGSAYDERRARCEAAARALGVPALRDADAAMLDERGSDLDPATLRRARHVITENARTLRAAEAMRAGDAAALGALMDASHASLRDDFEVSTPELDALVEIARAQEGCSGARMTGGGFGGCAVALVAEGAVDAFARAVAPAYDGRTGREATVYVCRAERGAERVL